MNKNLIIGYIGLIFSYLSYTQMTITKNKPIGLISAIIVTSIFSYMIVQGWIGK